MCPYGEEMWSNSLTNCQAEQLFSAYPWCSGPNPSAYSKYPLLTGLVSLAACIPSARSLPPPSFASYCQCCHRSQEQADQSLCWEEVQPLLVLSPQICSAIDACGRRSNHSSARVHKITAFTSLVVSISQSNKHRCSLCFLSATWKCSVSSCSTGPGKTWGLLTSSHSFITPAASPLPVCAPCKSRLLLVAPGRGPRGRGNAGAAELHPALQPMLDIGLSTACEPCWGPHSVQPLLKQTLSTQPASTFACTKCCLWGLLAEALSSVSYS